MVCVVGKGNEPYMFPEPPNEAGSKKGGAVVCRTEGTLHPSSYG